MMMSIKFVALIHFFSLLFINLSISRLTVGWMYWINMGCLIIFVIWIKFTNVSLFSNNYSIANLFLIAGEDERRAGKPRFKAEEEIAEARIRGARWMWSVHKTRRRWPFRIAIRRSSRRPSVKSRSWMCASQTIGRTRPPVRHGRLHIKKGPNRTGPFVYMSQ